MRGETRTRACRAAAVMSSTRASAQLAWREGEKEKRALSHSWWGEGERCGRTTDGRQSREQDDGLMFACSTSCTGHGLMPHSPCLIEVVVGTVARKKKNRPSFMSRPTVWWVSCVCSARYPCMSGAWKIGTLAVAALHSIWLCRFPSHNSPVPGISSPFAMEDNTEARHVYGVSVWFPQWQQLTVKVECCFLDMS